MRFILPVLAAAALALACDQQADVASSPPSAPADIGGTYEVKGVTVETESGSERKISGTIVLTQDGDSFTSSVSLDTRYPSEGGSLDAEVIGTGEGRINGSKLEGSTDVQLVLATVAGVDTQFAFIPRIVGPRISSSFTGEVAEDGSTELKIENRAVEGETYSPTRTTLRGVRVSRTIQEAGAEE